MTRVLAMHLPARNATQPFFQVWDYSARTMLPFVGVEFIATSDCGDPADLDHPYAENAILVEGADDLVHRGSACTALPATGTGNGWCVTVANGSITILDPFTGEIIGQAHVSAGGLGQFTLTWTKLVPVGKEVTIAALAFFGNIRYAVRVTDGDVSDLEFSPGHIHVFGAYDGSGGPQNFGFFSTGFVSSGQPITHGGRGLTWNKDYPPIIKQYLSTDECYVDPAPGGGMDGLAYIAAFGTDGWTWGGYGLQQHVVSALGNDGPVPLKGGVVHWCNGTIAQDSPYVVSGASGTPMLARSTFGHLAQRVAVCSDQNAESYGVGIMGDDGIGYCAALRMDHSSRACASRLVRQLGYVERNAGAGIELDMDLLLEGGFSYNLPVNAPGAYQVTQLVAPPVEEVN